MSRCSASDTMCVIPWVHLNIMPRGRVYHCCNMSDYNEPLGRLGEQTLEEMWNGEKLRRIRLQMLAGDKPDACTHCYRAEEAAGGEGLRKAFNGHFEHHLAEAASRTQPDGRVEQMRLAYWDFRFSNLCQLKCRTCGPDYSSAWIPDARRLGWLPAEGMPKVLEVKQVAGQANLDFLRSQIDQVEAVYFAGGEPLLMDEHWAILDLLEAHGRSDVRLTYNSNFGTLEYHGRHVLDHWVRWTGPLRVMPSIDEIGERAELIRSGTHWPSLQANLLKARAAGIALRPNITVSVFNVHRLPEIIDHLLDIDVVQVQPDRSLGLSLNLVHNPAHYSIGVLPAPRRAALIDRLQAYVQSCHERRGAEVQAQFLGVIARLGQADDSDVGARAALRSCTRMLDALRGEDTAAVVPELATVLALD